MVVEEIYFEEFKYYVEYDWVWIEGDEGIFGVMWYV